MSERLPTATTELVKQLFSHGEAFDSEGFATFFTDRPVYQFGNFEPCFSQAAIAKSTNDFFSKISAVYHDIKMMWETADFVFVEMDVTYWRKDDSVVTLPCSDVFRLKGNKFSELRIFMDVNPVFDSTVDVSDSSSVFILSRGKKLTTPEIMKNYYQEDLLANKRIETGFAPKWLSNQSIHEVGEKETDISEQLQVVQQLSENVINENWKQVKSFLTEDVFYKVGSQEPVYGKQAVVDLLSSLFHNTAKFTSHKVRKIWNVPGIVTVEMDALYTTVKDKKDLTIACCDIYRMRKNQVSEWRVYADIMPLFDK